MMISLRAETKGAAVSVFVTVAAVCAFAIASSNPPQGAGGVADGADLTLGDVTADKIGLANGTKTLASLYFTADDNPGDTGIYADSINEINFCAGNQDIASFSGGGFNWYKRHVIHDGFSLALGTASDVYLSGDEATATLQIGSANDGTNGVLDISGGGTATALKLGNGQTSTPAITFGDADSGIFGNAGTDISLVRNGEDYLTMNGGFISANKDFRIKGGARVEDDSDIAFGNGNDRFLQGESGTLADDTASEFVAIQSALGDAGGTVLTYTVKLTDATGVRAARTGTLTVATLDGAAGVTAGIGDVGQSVEESGTTTWAFTISSTDDGDLEIACQTTTTLTPTAITISWTANVSGDVTLSVTP